MKKVLILLSLILLVSCHSREFNIVSSALDKKAEIGDLGERDIITLSLFLDIEDNYEFEINDKYDLLWRGNLIRQENKYLTDELIIPYKTDEGDFLNVKIVDSKGDFKEKQIELPETKSRIYTIKDNLISINKEIRVNLTLFDDNENEIKVELGGEYEIPENIQKVKIEYDYLGVSYSISERFN